MRNISFLILTFSFYIISLNISSQNANEQGNPYIQNYNNKDFNTPEDQTWTIIQDQRGVMYFGNNNGVLEFDGNNWRLIEIPNKSGVRSLTMDDSTGRIYVGAVGDFGYLQTDSIGAIQYVSLINKIPEKYRSFDDVWQIELFNKQIIFVTYSYIFLLKENKIKVLIPEDKFHIGFCVNNKFHVREWGKGLLTLVNDSLKFIGQSGIFANERIYAMLPYESDKILMATRTQGIYIYSPNSITNRFIKPEKFQEVDNFINKNQIYCGIKLNKEQFVLGTFQNGLIIIDKNGAIIQHLNKKSGLQDQMILSLYIDSQKNIWVGLNNGISYIIKNSPFTFYNEKNGLEGTVYTTKKFKDRLYAGTSLGLFCRDQQNNFALLENTKGPIWNLSEIQGEFLLAHYIGIFIIKDNIAKNIAPKIRNVWTFNKLQNLSALSAEQAGDRQDKPYILTGTSNGLVLLEYSGKNWKLKHKIKGFNQSSRYLHIDNENNIWNSHPNKGIFRIKLNENLDSIAEIDFFNSNHGLPSNTNNFVFKINTNDQIPRIVFGTENGIYKFNPQTGHFVPDEKFEILLNNTGFIDKFIEDKKGNIYFQQGHMKGLLLLQNDGSYKLETTHFLKLKEIYLENISIIDTTTISYCSREGIIQYNPQIKPDYMVSYPATIRQVFANDSLIFGGKENTGIIIELPYKYNNLLITFSALYYEDHDKTQYSYYLDGFGEQWSEWSLKTEKEYTNLPEGSYIFKVKAKNIYEKESTIAQYEFEILAPWYRTIMAYIIYGIIAFIFIWFVVKFYTRRLKKEKENLEIIVTERTKNLHDTNTQLEEKQADLEIKQEEITTQAENLAYANKELEKHRCNLEQIVKERTADLIKAKEKAEESDKLKSAFLANMSHEIRTPMNAIIGFSSLLTDKKIAEESKDELVSHIIHNSDTLLHLIDDIIDIAKIEAEQLKINKQNCNINLIFSELLEIFDKRKQSIKKQHIKILIHTEVENKNFMVSTDPFRLQQVMTNLIDNALKYTEEGFVEFGYILENGNIKFFVKDTGIGLSKDQQAIIFSRFTKIEANKKKIYRGAGLGLAISKNLVNLLGGDIWVESEIENLPDGKAGGSTFYFTIPNTKETIKEERVEVKKSKISDFKWSEKTILIAEDEESNYLYFKMLLSRTKVNILHADTGIKAIEIYHKNKVDLILMDIKMPEMDGLEATKIIKKENKSIPIIALTAFAMENDEKMSFEAGCNAYVSKPINESKLLSLLDTYLT